jgi:transcriptional regulator with XRE-family HTH domain
MNNEHEKVTFSANLLRLMNENNKTRNEVSSETGIKYATLCEWINCRKYPRIDKIRLLADYFHVEKSELIEDRRYGERIGLTGERIRSLRIERNITQTELAAKINATKQTVYKYEQGIIANIPYDKMELLAEALNTTPAYLMGWEEKESNCTAKETMARNIKSYMNVGHISKQQLCNDLGFKYTTFLDWINAATYPRIEKIEAMADYFNCSKSDLIEEHCSGDFMSFENVNKLKKRKRFDERNTGRTVWRSKKYRRKNCVRHHKKPQH